MAKQWLSAADFPVQGYYDESGFVETGRPDIRNGLLSPENWKNIALQLGYQGPFETQVYAAHEGGFDVVPAPEFLQFIEQKKAEGYDFVTKADQINKDLQTIGLRLPSGEVVNQTPVKVSGFGDFFKEFVLPAVAAYGAVNFLGPRLEGLTNALSGGGPITAADVSALPTNAMGQVSQAPAVEVGAPLGAEGAGAMYADVPMAAGTETGLFGEQFHPIRNYPYSDITLNTLAEPTASVTTPAAAATDAAAAMQLPPITRLHPITFGGEPYLTAGAGGGAGAGAAGLSAKALDAALAGTAADLVGGSADLAGAMGGGQFSAAGMAPAMGAGGGATAGRTAAQALGGSLQAGATPGALGSVIGSTGAGTAIAAGAAPTILDQAIDLLKSPAGQAVVGGVGSVVGGVMQAEAAKDVAAQQATAAENALKLQREMFEYQKGLLEPYRTAGEAALKRLGGAMGLSGPAQQQQMLEMDPGYGFRLGEGMKALERMQAARGNMLSGGAMKAGQRYAQDYASGEYSNAFNRLADIAGIGRSTATQQGAAGERFGQSAGQTGMEAANALAAGRYGRTSAYTGALEGALGAYENYLNRQQRNQVYRDIYGRMLGGGG